MVLLFRSTSIVVSLLLLLACSVPLHCSGASPTREHHADEGWTRVLEGIDFGDNRRGLSTCGEDDRENAVCFKDTQPDVYEKSKAVGRFLQKGEWGSTCTGFLVGVDLFMTEAACIYGDLTDMEVEFMAEEGVCNAGAGWPSGEKYEVTEVVRVSGGVDDPYQYSIVRLAGEPALKYGFFELDFTTQPSDLKDSEIYIPQHLWGRGKQIATVDDTRNENCTILNAQDHPLWDCSVSYIYPYYSYRCDASFGSPIVSRETHKVIAMHSTESSWKNCTNEGYYRYEGANYGIPTFDIYEHVQPILNPQYKECAPDLVQFRIILTTNYWETKYELYNEDTGKIAATGNGFVKGTSHDYEIVRCVPPGEYTLIFAFGDSNAYSEFGFATYSIYLGDQLVATKHLDRKPRQHTALTIEPPRPACQSDPAWRTKVKRKQKTCDWVGQAPGSRCKKTGVDDGTLGFLGCKAECLCQDNCVDKSTWRFKHGRKKRPCSYLARDPIKWCSKVGTDGTYGYQSCPATCSCETLSA